ncbi:hypothetical protein EHH44_21770 [Mycolicibacter terrae]|uniref:Uncharacterized protein n=1 Tax=Mycolicibacter terrae TaxID=1788 RepID=A0ACD2EH36_9MYCO|nr:MULTISPECIES: hypothetical protein [Mycolicibacter]RRR39617.1 hypothetical protein EHH44_21770 [Mycolicibacter terrae]
MDPHKDARSKWLYWVVGPMVSATFLAIAFYSSMNKSETTDLIGAVVAGAIFAYLGFGAGYVRKRWPIGRWPGSRS